MLQLLPGLDKQVVTRRDLDGNALSGISCPDVETWITGAAMDSQEVEVGVESGQNGILFAIFDQVRRCRGQQVLSISHVIKRNIVAFLSGSIRTHSDLL
jgi:hypothetical protein